MSRKIPIIAIPVFLAVFSSCSRDVHKKAVKKENPEMYKTYKVHRINKPMPIDANFDKPQWKKVEPVDISLYMGTEPEHQPKTQAKMLYDDENIYVCFRVEDQYVRAVAQQYHGKVWEDSCVEFFFVPDADVSSGYFNLETNCGGTILMRHQTGLFDNIKKLKAQELDKIEIAHSLPKIIDPEITEPVTWMLEYRLPLSILQKYHDLTKPAPGVKWRANFYKCADKTSHPHWLTWSRIVNEIPDFHRPKFFGTLEFVE